MGKQYESNGAKYAIAAAHPEVRRRLERRSVADDKGCINWTGGVNERGYGTMTIGGVYVYVHRLAYTVRVGPIPNDKVIDHLCQNPRCLNTEHMALADTVSNSRRNLATLRTSCPSGHEYTCENTAVYIRGGHKRRYCITCRNERNRKRYAGNAKHEIG